jgi:hypothetical protein
MSVPIILAMAGVIALLIGVLGGGIKAKEVEIPWISPRGRVVSFVAGLGLIGIAIWLSLGPVATNSPGMAQQTAQQETAVLTLTVSPSQTPEMIRPYQVLVDTRHQTESTYEVLRTANLGNFAFTKSGKNEWTLDSLLPYDALIINFAWYPENIQVEQFTSVEIQAVRDYLDQGGNVLLIGLAWVWTAYKQGTIEDYPLNLIATPYGITFNTNSYACPRDAEDLIEINTSLMNAQHPIVNGLNLLASKPGNAVSDLSATSPADVVISCTKSSAILATLQTPKSRLAALSGGTFVFENLDDTQYNNYELLKNLLSWLVMK